MLVKLERTGKSRGYGETDLIQIPDNCEKEFRFCGRVIAIGKRAVTDAVVGDCVIVDTYSQYIFSTREAGRYAIIEPCALIAVLPHGVPKYMDIVPSGARELAEVA